MASWAGGPGQDGGQGQGPQAGPSQWWEPEQRVDLPRRPIGNLIRTAFDAYSRSFGAFLCLSGLVYALAAIVLVPVYLNLSDLVGRIFEATPLSPTSATYPAFQALMAQLGPQEAVLSVVAAVVTAVMQPLALGAVVAGTPEAAQGQPVVLRVAVTRFMARLRPLLGLALIFVVIQGGVALAGAGLQLAEPSFVSSDAAGTTQLAASLGVFFVLGVGVLCLEILGLYLYLRWFVAIPLIVIDGLGLRAAVARSGRLTAGSRWYILGALVLIFLLQLLFNLLIEVVAAIIGIGVGAASLAGGALVTGSGGDLSFSAGFGTLAGRATAFSSLISLLLGAIYYPVIAIAMAILRSDFTWRAETAAQLRAPSAGPLPPPGS